MWYLYFSPCYCFLHLQKSVAVYYHLSNSIAINRLSRKNLERYCRAVPHQYSHDPNNKHDPLNGQWPLRSSSNSIYGSFLEHRVLRGKMTVSVQRVYSVKLYSLYPPRPTPHVHACGSDVKRKV